MADRLVFFNTGWMVHYRGLGNDTIFGGGKHVDSQGWGHEMFNFKSFNGKLYGFVQPKLDKKYGNPSIIKIEKIGAQEGDKTVTGVTIVWTARDPYNGGTYIIGWYKNATIYRHYQTSPSFSNRRYRNYSMGYYSVAKAKDCRLLPIDERLVKVQRQKKNWMGESNVWYAEHNAEFVSTVKDYIFKGILPEQSKKKKAKGKPRQPDPLKRIEVEKKAVLHVTKHYRKLGYQIESFEKDNVGWDLLATNNKTQLKLEVKGLSGNTISTELTPNEYLYLNGDKKFYRLCIVTKALTKPFLRIFSYSKDTDEWTCQYGTVIKFEEVISARVFTN
jgi:hypothetical protein